MQAERKVKVLPKESTKIKLFTSTITLSQILSMHLPQLNPDKGVAHMNKRAD